MEDVDLRSAVSALSAGAALAQSGTVVFGNAGGVSFGAAAGSVITAAAPAQSVQPGIQSVSAGAGRITTGEVVLADSNGLSWGVNGQSITGAYTQSTHSHSTSPAAIAAGANSITSGTVVLVDSNGIGFGINGQSITASHNGLTAAVRGLGVSNVGNTAGDTGTRTGTVVLAGAGGISLTQATAAGVATISISGPSTAGLGTGNLGGIAAGSQTATTGTVVLANSNGFTFGMSESSQITASRDGLRMVQETDGATLFTGSAIRFMRGADPFDVQFSLNTAGAPGEVWVQARGLRGGISTHGNTAGTTGFVPERLLLVGTHGVSLSQSANASHATLSIDVRPLSAGISTMGNTAGTTGLVASQLVIVGASNISLSQSVNGHSATLSLVCPDPAGAQAISSFHNMSGGDSSAMQASGCGHGQLHLFPLTPGRIFPGVMTVKTANVYISVSGSTATLSSGATSTFNLGVYSVVTSNPGGTVTDARLVLINSASSSFGQAAASANSTAWQGIRFLSFHSSLWSTTPTFTHGNYYLGFFVQTSVRSAQSFSLMGKLFAGHVSNLRSGWLGVSGGAGSGRAAGDKFLGIYNTTTAAFPGTISGPAVAKTNILNGVIPYVFFNNYEGSADA